MEFLQDSLQVVFGLLMLSLLLFFCYLQRKPRWRPPIITAAVLWFALGGVLPTAFRDILSYETAYHLFVVLIPSIVIGLDFLRWKWIDPQIAKLLGKKT